MEDFFTIANKNFNSRLIVGTGKYKSFEETAKAVKASCADIVTVAVRRVNILNKDEGGRHTPFFKNYRPQFYFRTTDVTGTIELPAGTEMVMPGDNVSLSVELLTPIAMDKGLKFAIREGGRTVGAGVVADIVE